MTATLSRQSPWRSAATALGTRAGRVAEPIATPLVPTDYLDLSTRFGRVLHCVGASSRYRPRPQTRPP